MFDEAIGPPPLNEAEQRVISEFVEREFGIKMPPSKKSLLQGRLAKRLAACRITSYGRYFDFITKDPAGRDEFLHFTDLVSTHETSFFREDKHFGFLSEVVMPRLAAQTSKSEIRVLSAACSSGEEAYSLAMQISDDLLKWGRQYTSVFVEGFDLSQRMVDVATRAVYTGERIVRIPLEQQKRYLMRSKNHHEDLYRFVPELRSKMFFHTGNLLSAQALSKPSYDIIFCRNVLIYFDHANQVKAIANLLKHLDPDGYLFLGHSESMSRVGLPIRPVGNAVFQIK